MSACCVYGWVVAHRDYVTSHIWGILDVGGVKCCKALCDDSCRTYEWVMSHIWISHVSLVACRTCVTESRGTHEFDTAHIRVRGRAHEWNTARHIYEWMSHGAYMYETWHIHVWLTYGNYMNETGYTHEWMSHGTHTNEWVMAHIRINESWHTHEWDMAHTWMKKTWHTHYWNTGHVCAVHSQPCVCCASIVCAWVCFCNADMANTLMKHRTHMAHTCMHASRHTYELEVPQKWMNESWHAHEWVMARTWMSHGTHTNEHDMADIRMNSSWRTHEWVRPHVWMNEWGHTWMNAWMREVGGWGREPFSRI